MIHSPGIYGTAEDDKFSRSRRSLGYLPSSNARLQTLCRPRRKKLECVVSKTQSVIPITSQCQRGGLDSLQWFQLHWQTQSRHAGMKNSGRKKIFAPTLETDERARLYDNTCETDEAHHHVPLVRKQQSKLGHKTFRYKAVELLRCQFWNVTEPISLHYVESLKKNQKNPTHTNHCCC